MTVDAKTLLAVLRAETQTATGCTEVAGAALVAAKAVSLLTGPAEGVDLSVSPNIYKNGIHVGVPGTDLRGLGAAAALGAVIAAPEAGLGVLDAVDDGALAEAGNWLENGRVMVRSMPEAPDPVYLKAEAWRDGETAVAIALGSHERIVELYRNGEVVERAEGKGTTDKGACDRLREARLFDLLRLIDGIPPGDLAFLVEAARMNLAAAEADLADAGSTLGPALQRNGNASRVQALTGAAAEARMRGLQVPVKAITSSGNHGIANFLGVYAMATERGADETRLARALAIASTVTVYIKSVTGRLTTYCGCAIAPATGVAAASVDLMGGGEDEMVHAMHSVIGTFAGMLCDGAKESCAFKVSTAVGSAVDMAELALDGAYVPDGNGIVGASIEETVANLARLNDPGLKAAERTILDIITQGSQTAGAA